MIFSSTAFLSSKHDLKSWDAHYNPGLLITSFSFALATHLKIGVSGLNLEILWSMDYLIYTLSLADLQSFSVC